MKKTFKLIFLFCFFLTILSCEKQKAATAVDNIVVNNIVADNTAVDNIELFEPDREEIAVFLAENFKIGSWQTDGVLTGKIDNLFSEVIINRNNISSLEHKNRLTGELNSLLNEYEIYWEEGASDSIDARLMLITEIFFDLILSMLEPGNRTEIINNVNERVETSFPSDYDLGLIDYKIMIDLFDILTCPDDPAVINNKINYLFEFIGGNPVKDDEGYYITIDDDYYYNIDPKIAEFINNLKNLKNQRPGG
jgi:hypothetical protein